MSRPLPTLIGDYPTSECDFRIQPVSKKTKGFKVTEQEERLLKDLQYSFSQKLDRPVTESELFRNMIDFCITNDEYFLNKIPFLKVPLTAEPQEETPIIEPQNIEENGTDTGATEI